MGKWKASIQEVNQPSFKVNRPEQGVKKKEKYVLSALDQRDRAAKTNQKLNLRGEGSVAVPSAAVVDEWPTGFGATRGIFPSKAKHGQHSTRDGDAAESVCARKKERKGKYRGRGKGKSYPDLRWRKMEGFEVRVR
ncbi:unnamed protein product [Tuber aestivum]|uniref:Uncharacterized protein n=1 Tax=Tuber aestivum TaxID=59557 RepID=A0A292PSN0_9PEZI|nr:unnamed protein product [Tuber aestivum]